MTSFDEQMQAAEGRRQEEAAEEQRRREARDQETAAAAERLRQIRYRAEQLVPEVYKAANALRKSGRRQSGQLNGWCFTCDQDEVQVVFTIDFGHLVKVRVHTWDVTVDVFASEGFYVWQNGMASDPSVGGVDYWVDRSVEADDALEQLLVQIADYLTKSP